MLLRQLRPRPHLKHYFPSTRHPPTRISLVTSYRQMSSPTSRKVSVPHTVRTAAEPRQNRLFTVRLSHIEDINPTVRLLQLTIPPSVQRPGLQEYVEESEEADPLTFFPGQWLDVHIPTVANAGGFSITSTPADAQVLPSLEPSPELNPAEEAEIIPVNAHGREPFVELAVQKVLSNPASAWLWKPKEEILGKELSIRVGGSFVWPPSKVKLEEIRNVVFVVGGVGINPIMSMLSHLNNNDETTGSFHPSLDIHILYSSKLPHNVTPETALNQIPFLPRLREIVRSRTQSQRLRITLDIFLTNNQDPFSALPGQSFQGLTIQSRRIGRDDLRKAVSGRDSQFKPEETVCYVCGPPQMTNEVVDVLGDLLDGQNDRIYFEKWW